MRCEYAAGSHATHARTWTTVEAQTRAGRDTELTSAGREDASLGISYEPPKLPYLSSAQGRFHRESRIHMHM